MPWVASPAPAVSVGCLCEASQAEAALRQPVDQALPGICGCVLHPILPVRVELASELWGQVAMLVILRLHSSCVPLSLATGINRRGPAAGEKADSRNARRARSSQLGSKSCTSRRMLPHPYGGPNRAMYFASSIKPGFLKHLFD
jgi:hypothetical protein